MVEVVKRLVRILQRDRRGVTAVEYALVAGLIVAAVATAVTTLGGKISDTLATIGSSL